MPFFVAQCSRLRNRDLGIAPTEHPAPCGSDAFVVPHLTLGEGKPGTLSNKKGYRGLIRQDGKTVSKTYV
jgi:hypothetical protein